MRKLVRVLVLGYLAYLAAAVLLILPALNILPGWYVQRTFDRSLSTGIVLFNPFTLALELRDARLPERDGARFLVVGRAELNLSLASLWHPGWVFDKVLLENLYLHIRQLPGGRFNFSDLAPPAAEPAPASPVAIPALAIGELDLHSEHIVFTDETRPSPFSTQWDDIQLRARDLSTVREAGQPYRFQASSEAGGTLSWEGDISIPAARSSGRLTLSNISLATGWRFIEPWVRFELTDGRLHVGGQYELGWGEGLSYSVTQGEVALTGIAIEPTSGEPLGDTGVALQDLTVAAITLDSTSRHVRVGAVTVEGLELAGWSEGSRVSLVELFAPEAAPDPAAAAAPRAAPPAEPEAGAWTAEVASFALSDSSIRWRSPFTEPPLLEVTPITATADNIQWPLAGSSRVGLTLAVNNQASLALEGELALASGDGTVDYRLQGLPLAWFNPNFPAALQVRISSGTAGAEGNVLLAEFAPASVATSGAVSGFAGKLRNTEDSLTAWDSIAWDDLQIDLDQRRLSLQKLLIQGFSGRLHIHRDGTINAQKLWLEELAKHEDDDAANGSDAPAADTDPAPTPWAISVPNIVIANSRLDFMDESLPLPFRTVLGELNGTITGLGTAADAQARVELKGSVDGYAPVSLAGTAQPLAPAPALDLALQIDGVDMALLSPYAATYAGYAIDRGLLSLKLRYALLDSRLQGENRLVLRQMKLGGKVDSPKALDIPLKLALALLTDSEGVIDLDVPVSGNIQDPKFSVGAVVMKTFANLLTRAVTAPFSLLAKLVGSEQDLHSIEFGAGSAVLDTLGKSKLDELSTALQARPQLTLLISGSTRPVADRAGLRQNALRAQLLAGGLTAADLGSNSPAWEAAVRTRAQDLPADDRASAAEEDSAQQVYQRLLDSIEVTPAQLGELAQARAIAVKSYLLNEAQLDPARAVIGQPLTGATGEALSGVELGIDR